jgi:hypothetical protein
MTNDIVTGDLRDLRTLLKKTCGADGMLSTVNLAKVYKCEYCRVYLKSQYTTKQ